VASLDERYCPICEERMTATLCPTDGVHTIAYSSVRATSSQLESGTVIAERYRIEGLLGSGAMGSVYSATQMAVDRRIALKVLPREMLRDGSELRRFHREAKNASRLMHPHVVRVHDFGIDGLTEMPYIAMEQLEGRTLRRIIADEAPIDVGRACRILEQVSRALIGAHQAGIIHRDLKPDNIMVTMLSEDDEHVTVLDFGIAKSVRRGGLLQQLTASGVVVGTPRYMSPEQVRGTGIGPRSDLYAVGCILHEMLTGRSAFAAEDSVALMLKHVNSVRPVLPWVDADPATSSSVRVLHGLLLSKRPEGRPLNAARVARVLRKIAQGRPPADTLGILMDSAPVERSEGPGSSDDMAGPIDGSLLAEGVAPTVTRGGWPDAEPDDHGSAMRSRPVDPAQISLARAAMLPLSVLLGSIAIAIAIWLTFGGSSGASSRAPRLASPALQCSADNGR
jgi:serine/threonine protein kinase